MFRPQKLGLKKNDPSRIYMMMTYSNRVLNSTVRNADFPLSAKGTYPKGLKTHKERRRLRLHGYVALQSLPMDEQGVRRSPVEMC